MTASLLATIAGAFLAGSVPFGVLVSRAFFKTDIRGAGSGNIGAANALRTLGRRAGIAILVLDALKGIAGVTLAQALAPAGEGPLYATLGAFCATAGHCYTPWLGWRGGKGVATFLGATFAIAWPAGIAFCSCWLLVVALTGIAAIGSMLGATVAGAVIVAHVASGQRSVPASIVLAAVLLIVWKHRENIARLRTGSENRLDLLKK